jgi:hypothetical protein
MPRKPALSPLAAKLDQLGITVEECAAVCGVPVEVVTGFIENGPDAEGAIRLRWLDDDADGQRRIDQLRRTHTRDLRGDGMTYAGIDPDRVADRTPPVQTGGQPT